MAMCFNEDRVLLAYLLWLFRDPGAAEAILLLSCLVIVLELGFGSVSIGF
jgi:hypothetical protein